MRARLLMWAAMGACLSTLGGCGNFVRATTPPFGPADEVGAIPLRQGVWEGHEPGCSFDPKRPIKTWPACAEGFAVDERGLKDPSLQVKVDRVAAGTPMIVQLADSDGFTYAAVEVLRTDRRGKATRIAAWSVLCGPPPSDTTAATPAPTGPVAGSAPTAPAPSEVPRQLLPGLEPDDVNCLAHDADVVRAAAVASKPWSSAVTLEWMRAGRR